MSQSKVEQRKYEKQHRQEIIKKEKRKKFLAKAAAVIVIVGIVGGIAGFKIYQILPKYTDAKDVSTFVDDTWSKNGYDNLFTAKTPADNETDAGDAADAADTDEELGEGDAVEVDDNDTFDVENAEVFDEDAIAE